MEHLGLDQLVVLLVEPSYTQRRIVDGFLRDLGIREVLVAEHGANALAQLADYEPDLVISALYLPDMTGTDLVHRIRGDSALGNTAFILISSETSFRALDPVRQAGAVAVLPKPFNIEALSLALQNTVDLLDGSNVELKELDVEDVNVLIVDDSKMSRKHIRRVLNGMGLEKFTEASDGVEALSLMNLHFFDLVVTDYNMPNMDGKELIEHIRQETAQASVPILMVTSEANAGRLAAVSQAGVSSICDKPFEPDTVRRFLQKSFAR